MAFQVENIPRDIVGLRQRVFQLASPVLFDRDAWDRIWPYVDNVWNIRVNSGMVPNVDDFTPHTLRGTCVFHESMTTVQDSGRDPQPPRRSSRSQPSVKCPAELTVTLLQDGRVVLEKTSIANHNHDLDHADKNKRNSGIMALLVQEQPKGQTAKEIFLSLKGPTIRLEHRDMVDNAGGKHVREGEIASWLYAKRRKEHSNKQQENTE